MATIAIAGSASAEEEIVIASYYGGGDGYDGLQMANGDYFDEANIAMAAHKTLPFCTQVRLQNFANGNEVTIVITDRGPFTPGRDYDLSYAAAQALEYVAAGTAQLVVLYEIPPVREHVWGESCDRYLG